MNSLTGCARILKGTVLLYRTKLSTTTSTGSPLNFRVSLQPIYSTTYDETNLSDDPGRKKVITRRGCNYPERAMNSTKTAVSVMFSAAVDGTILPPYVVYKAVHLYGSWTTGGPQHARYNRSKSGWFESSSFEDWLCTIAKPYLKRQTGKRVLIGDNLAAH